MKDNLLGVINTNITRRSFLKWSAAVGATASAAGLVMNKSLKGAGAATPPSSLIAPATGATANGGTVVEWVPTHCLVCHSWCQLAVGLDSDGNAVKIEGCGGQNATAPSRKDSSGTAIASSAFNAGELRYDPADSANPAAGSKSLWGNPDDKDRFPAVADGFLAYGMNNKGRICAKGNNGLQHLYDPDRIKYPMKRRSGTARGAGKWEKISWRQAYWEIANVIRELRGETTNVDGSANGSTRGSNQIHRYCLYVGRNESSAQLGAGTPNHVEHTSLCESSRHQSTHTMFGHHFPFPDLNSHSGARQSTSDPKSSADIIIEIGGNPCEAKIPHSSYAVRFGDRRRRGCRIIAIDVRQSNTAAFADEWLAIEPGTDGALVMGMLGVIFREVTPATLESELLAGHLGGVSHNASTRRWTGIFSSEKTAGAFTPSLPDTSATGNGVNIQNFQAGTTALVAPVDTLQDELASMFGAGFNGGGTVTDAPEVWAASVTGLDSADVKYLAGAVSGADVTGANPNWAGTATFLNPIIDGYRGPSKHTNGTYNWRAIRTLQVIAGRFQINAATGLFDPAQTSGTYARGGIERPGGLMVNGWGANTGGYINNYSAIKLGGSSSVGNSPVGGHLSTLPKHTYPYASNKWNGVHDTVTIDRWDYNLGRTKFGIGTQGVDQNFVPGMRASLGLHPYKAGATVTVARTGALTGDVILPYGHRQTQYVASTSTNGGNSIYVGPQAALANIASGDTAYIDQGDGNGLQTLPVTVNSANATTGEIVFSGAHLFTPKIGDHLVVDLADGNAPDADFKVEALMLFKNAPGNTRANIKLFQELVTAKDGSGNYKLANIWSIDAYMGDATRFADIVLPDTSYLERWEDKDWEVIGLKGHWELRQPVLRKYMSQPIWAPKNPDLFLYDARPVNSLSRELANAIAGNTTNPFTNYSSSSAVWISGDEDYDQTVVGTEGEAWDVIKLGGIGAWKQVWYDKGANGSLPEIAGAHSTAARRKFAFLRVFGAIYDSNQTINEYTGYDSVFGGHGGWAKQNAPRTWLAEDLITDAAGVPGDWADGNDPGAKGGTRGYTALEIYNHRMTHIVEPSTQYDATLPGAGAAGGHSGAAMSALGYRYRGVPVWQRPVEETDGTYGVHLTTYKLNVHTQSRTASLPRLSQIIGNTWAVMHPTTAGTIANGDTVKVETRQGSVTLEAKVTTKIKPGVVAISNSFGHEDGLTAATAGSQAGRQEDASVGTTVYASQAAFGNFRVSVGGTEVSNRSATAKSDGGTDAYHDLSIAAVSDYTLGTPSAPGAGIHPNHAIQRTIRNLGTSASLAMDPVGTSFAWFDSKCKISKITT